MVDLHCHVLPGVDDGPDKLEISLKMLEVATSQGVTAICATPHVDSWADVRTEALLQDRMRQLRDAVITKGISIELHLGSEIYFGLGIENLRNYSFSTLGGNGKYWLVEFSTDIFPAIVENFVLRSISWGRIPVLAHTERYSFLHSRPKYLTSIVKAGALIQVDAGSFTGLYGKRLLKRSQYLVTSGLCHLVASDAHDVDKKPYRMKQGFQVVSELLGSSEAELLFTRNPQAILEGGDIVFPKGAKQKQDDKESSEALDSDYPDEEELDGTYD
jgi:protein-tyrosine phosphatase